ncbi:hypothetical protein RRG08_039732 [Elysia crispata]|uniref:Uncharacterized protein n=1 Tax=Elysia crispata TaxID=231223 RepID=A0AAE1CV80_9GAST|nr:hypothetical protein RRG08_039732 [Elysia crispata]
MIHAQCVSLVVQALRLHWTERYSSLARTKRRPLCSVRVLSAKFTSSLIIINQTRKPGPGRGKSGRTTTGGWRLAAGVTNNITVVMN